MSQREFKFSLELLLIPLYGVLTIWAVFWFEVVTRINLSVYGILPRDLIGLRGILLGPFIHGSTEHLYNNTFPLAVLSLALFYFYRPVAWKVLIWGWLITGIITWVIGRESYHIGISGIIYLLVSFIFFKGVFQKHFRLVALSLVVVFLYGSMLWYIFPVEEGISWEGHLSGFFAGLVLAKSIKVPLPKVKKYEWQQADFNEAEDEFLKHFDEEGNFIENPGNVEESDVKITYHFKENRED
ncbi:MAG: rhomboid family intramembrane serine protease [Bacteroidota bacterium]